MNKNIEWRVTSQETTEELTSKDNRWHISKTKNGDTTSFFMSNYDILLAPHGKGSDYVECFESFIKDCDKYIEQVEKVREEAKQYYKELKDHENH